MKKILFYILAIVFTATCATSCSSDKEKEQEQEIPTTITIIGTDKPTLETAAGTYNLSFDCNNSWTASSGQSWCKISPTSGGAGRAQITITVEENTSTSERNAQIIIRSDNVSKSVTVTQKQKNAITLTSNKVEVNGKGGAISIEVSANVNYTCEIEASAKSWIEQVTSKAMTKSIVNFNVKANDDTQKREGKIVIKSGAISETFTVYQDGGEPSIVISQDEYTVPSSGQEITIQIRSNVSYKMIMPANVDWLTESTAKAVSDYTHKINVAPNETYDPREANIIFEQESGSIRDTVKIVQVQKNAIIVAQNEYIINAEDTQMTFEVSSNVDYEVSSSVEWIKYVPPTTTKGLTTKTLTFTIEPNTSSSQRNGVITVASGELKQEIKITQLSSVAQTCKVIIKHSNMVYTAPTLSGEGVSAVINWGDGTQDEYTANATHEYASQGEYTVEITISGANQITLPNIVKINEIDLTEF